jgi:hypothetical protein
MRADRVLWDYLGQTRIFSKLLPNLAGFNAATAQDRGPQAAARNRDKNSYFATQVSTNRSPLVRWRI